MINIPIYPYGKSIGVTGLYEKAGGRMTREEAIQRFNGIKNAMSISVAQSKFYPSKAELDELCDMAIEALKADVARWSSWNKTFEQSGIADLISRAEVHKTLSLLATGGGTDAKMLLADAHEFIDALPSADSVDCTDFIEWLVDRVLDETIWEYNSVAYGEIICRKLEKLGVLEVTEEPSYYIRPSADTVQGEWIDVDNEPYCECSVCGSYIDNLDDDYAFCPRCGARMHKGGDSE